MKCLEKGRLLGGNEFILLFSWRKKKKFADRNPIEGGKNLAPTAFGELRANA